MNLFYTLILNFSAFPCMFNLCSPLPFFWICDSLLLILNLWCPSWNFLNFGVHLLFSDLDPFLTCFSWCAFLILVSVNLSWIWALPCPFSEFMSRLPAYRQANNQSERFHCSQTALDIQLDNNVLKYRELAFLSFTENGLDLGNP